MFSENSVPSEIASSYRFVGKLMAEFVCLFRVKIWGEPVQSTRRFAHMGKRMKTKAKCIVKTCNLMWAVILCLASGWTGYWLHDQRADAASVLGAAGTIPPLDYLVGPESFSKIENTRDRLEALCIRLRLEVQSRLLAKDESPTLRTSGSRLEATIRDLEQGMREFEGTEQEQELAGDLLPALKEAGRFDRW